MEKGRGLTPEKISKLFISNFAIVKAAMEEYLKDYPDPTGAMEAEANKLQNEEIVHWTPTSLVNKITELAHRVEDVDESAADISRTHGWDEQDASLVMALINEINKRGPKSVAIFNPRLGHPAEIFQTEGARLKQGRGSPPDTEL